MCINFHINTLFVINMSVACCIIELVFEIEQTFVYVNNGISTG